MEKSPNTMVESRREFMISATAGANAEPVLRTAHFLKPSLFLNHPGIPSLSLPCLPASFDPKTWPFTVKFNGYKSPNKSWKEWVEKMASIHAPTWKKAGIYDAILFSTCKIYENSDLILGVSERWFPQTNSFIFPWGEATVTLEDMLIAGYSVLGSPVSKPLETDESMAVQEVLGGERKKLNKTPAKKPYHRAWLTTFMDSGSEIEHEAFLSLWLSRFVLPTSNDCITECVFPIAIHLAKGTRIALAPAVLATIYRDLSLLKQTIVSLTSLAADSQNKDEQLVVTTYAPFQLVLVWVWERFPKLSPKPNLLNIGEPRFAQWNNVKCNTKGMCVRSLLNSSKESFIWRPYTKPLENWDFPKFYGEREMWVSSKSDLDDDLLSFIQCLRASELVGPEFNCMLQYLPQRVARQFGFDQDLPGFVVRCTASSEDDWNCNVSGLKCFIPPRLFEKDVTTRYFDWWNTFEFHNNDSKVLKEMRISEATLKSSQHNIEEMNTPSVPPGFTTKCNPVKVDDTSEDDDCNLIASPSQNHSCSTEILRGSDQVAAMDVDPENIVVELGDSSSVAGNDQTTNDSEIQDATMDENENERVTLSLAANENNNINRYLLLAEEVRAAYARLERLEKFAAQRKAWRF